MAKSAKKPEIQAQSKPAEASGTRPVARVDALRREFDRLLDLVTPGDWRLPDFGGRFEIRMPDWADWQARPAVNLTETENAYSITVEVPGMDQDNVEVTVSNGVLTIKGEKREEKEEKKKDYHLSERRFGRFQRSFRLPEGVDADRLDAKMANGVLSVTLPKSPSAQAPEKKIAIKVA